MHMWNMHSVVAHAYYMIGSFVNEYAPLCIAKVHQVNIIEVIRYSTPPSPLPLHASILKNEIKKKRKEEGN